MSMRILDEKKDSILLVDFKLVFRSLLEAGGALL
jgi:hypothetical protein